jgi:hypothetical protein
VLHNTIVAENRTAQQVSNAHFANNLFLGTDAPVGIASVGGPTAYSTYDYNGYRPNAGVTNQFAWLGPRAGMTVDYEQPANQAPRFPTLAALAAATGQETHSIEVDYDIFTNVRQPIPPDSGKGNPPYDPADVDFRLKAGSRAIDAGRPLPNVNDAFTGAAPDLGAYELGQPLPIYGPRGITGPPFYR